MNESLLDSQVQRLATFITDWIPGEPSESGGAIDTAIRLLSDYVSALAFYAEPNTYFATAFMFDRPAGAFEEDFSYDEEYQRPMPGKLARQVLKWEPDNESA